ncbi:hypothetical protein M3650_29920 [Paenibacillus sp. MER TA 81-3]|uniref:hypothetical protein n=1 Tax=Paenibacillus sp. MER TA 81-3 TaxID=2939573 RepID=UPI00203D8499|nr:hypothetical protein [Paenibacillus sp. MER TA 81-3]MCM3342728.1 hypothetical protein [Paenibacillus sp. MER TA 81-3]
MTQQDEQIKRQLQEDMSKYELDDAVKVYILSQARPSIWERTVRFRLSRAIACGCFGMLLIVAPLWLPFAASSYVKTDAVPGQQQITYIVEGKWLVREDLLSRGEKDAYR